MNSDSKSSGYYPYPGSPDSSASAGNSNISSWGTLPTPAPGTPDLVPSTPYLAPVPLPVCCPPGHQSPVSDTSRAANPALQQPYNVILPPQQAPYSSEPATHPPVATLTLRLTPHPNTRIPSMDFTLSSAHPGPLTVHDIYVFVSHTLSRQVTRSDLQALTDQVAYDAVLSAFHLRTANDSNAFANGMCVGDRMGGAWWIVGVVPTAEPGVWEVRLDAPRRR